MYHRFGESAHPSTNIRIDQFEAHIAELQSGGYTVLPIPDIIAAIDSGQPLPDRTVGITIDDAYLSVYTEAWPRLRRAGFPFTLFVATDAIDREFASYMSWDQIRDLRDNGVTIGSQTATHLHMPANREARNRQDIQLSNQRFRSELGAQPAYFAYPFGEASASIQQIIKEAGFAHAFGQHSGALHASSDRYYMPRFALNENFGDTKRFKLVANALPVPHTDLSPLNPTLTTNPPLFGFTLSNDASSLRGLTCYSGDQGKLQMQRLGPRVEVRLARNFSPGRARINCTALGPDGRWRWLGMLYYVPKP
ncbi:MAG: polysaccharide deacetylase family protein [Alphaproteobacteria bacterium]|nr:polysaccharide deacetylase family protein [Alphaproteobacteria bacterium]